MSGPGAVRSDGRPLRPDVRRAQHVDAARSVVLTANGGTARSTARSSRQHGTLGPLRPRGRPTAQGCPTRSRARGRVLQPSSPSGRPRRRASATRSPSPGLGVPAGGQQRRQRIGLLPTSVNFTMRGRRQRRPDPDASRPSFTVEGDTTGGWTADWSGLAATDPEDDPDPTPSCAPRRRQTSCRSARRHVACSVTDSGGLVR